MGIPDKLCDEIKRYYLKKNLFRTIVGRPVILCRKVLDGILYILRIGCQWGILPKTHGSGSIYSQRFQE
jgi:transposase